MLLDIGTYGYDDDEAFCRDLAEKIGVALVPASTFFKEPVHHLARLQFAVRDETLAEALHRLEGIHKLKKYFVSLPYHKEGLPMKKWHLLLAALCLTVSTMTVLADGVPEGTQTGQSSAVILTDPTVNMKNLSDFYILEGRTYEKVTGLLMALPPQTTGLTGDYYFRVDKQVVGDYFYHVKAYDTDSHVLKGNYFVAKDESSAWKLQNDQQASLIYGSAEKLMDKVEVVVYPQKIPLGSYGIIRVHVPGMIPYDIKATSLNTKIADITEHMNIRPLEAGKVDLVVDVKIGDSLRTVTKEITVVDEADRRESKSRNNPSVGVGIGIGWGSGWHHGGGIGIGVGPWW